MVLPKIIGICADGRKTTARAGNITAIDANVLFFLISNADGDLLEIIGKVETNGDP